MRFSRDGPVDYGMVQDESSLIAVRYRRELRLMGEQNSTEPIGDFLDRILRGKSVSQLDLNRLLDAPAEFRERLADRARFFLRSYPLWLQDLSEDVVQDVLLDLGNILKRFGGRSSVQTYLDAVVLNKCKNRIRASKTSVQWPDGELSKTGEIRRFDPPAKSLAPVQHLIQSELEPIRQQMAIAIRDAIPQLLEALTPQEKRVLQLRYGDPDNPADWESISRVLNIGTEAAKRTRDRLRRKIEEDWLPDLLRPVLAKYPHDGVDAKILICRVCKRQDSDQIATDLGIERKEVSRRMRDVTDSVMSIVASVSVAGLSAEQTTHKNARGQS